MGDMEPWLVVSCVLLAISNLFVLWRYRYRPLWRRKKATQGKPRGGANTASATSP